MIGMRRRLVSFSIATFAKLKLSEALFISLSLSGNVSSRVVSSTSTSTTHQATRRFLLTTAPCLLFPQFVQAVQPFSTTSCAAGSNDEESPYTSGTSTNTNTDSNNKMEVDPEYPGTAVQRLKSVHARVATLTEEELSGDWEDVRRKILWAGGLKDLSDSIPGQVRLLFIIIFV